MGEVEYPITWSREMPSRPRCAERLGEAQMNLDEQLKALLAGLGVEMEREGEIPFDDGAGEDDEEDLLSPIALFQASKDHYGVFYRLDLIEGCPQLRVFLPAN